MFVAPRGDEGFFELPWPSDLRRDADGTIDVLSFPNPSRNGTLADYLETMSSRLDGWGTNGCAYFTFTAPIDAATLPADPAATLLPTASAFLIDVDPSSPQMGTRHPAVVHYREGGTIYWPDNTVAIRPVYGIPLAPSRTYAAVITSNVLATDGSPVSPDDDFAALLDGTGDGAVAAVRTAYGPALDVIASRGIPRESIVSLAVFTTQDPTSELIAVRDWMMASYPEPAATASDWVWEGDIDALDHVEGRWGPVPIFQSGPSPYMDPGSGEIVIEGGTPVVAEEVELPFALTVPTSAMPPDGYPVVLYAHGTGGDYNGFVNSDIAQILAELGYAVLGIDQVLHGERNPTTDSPDFLFFNFLNPLAARDNVRQAALDVVQQARLVATLEIPDTILVREGGPVRLDPSRIYVFGHSQGGLNMPLFLAIDDQTHGGVLSAAGATLAISIIEKTDPIEIALAVRLFLSLPGSTTASALETEHFVYEHPVLTMLQTWIEAGDGSNYGALLFERPRDGFAPKSVLQTQGTADTFTSPNAGESLASAASIPVVRPAVRPVPGLALRDIAPTDAPVTGNVGGGAATAGLLQFDGGDHFVVFNDEAAQGQIRGFFETFATGTPTIPAR